MIKPYPILIEAVLGDRAQTEQRVPELVDHPTEKVSESLAGLLIGISRNFHCNRQAKDVIVERPRSSDVGNGQPDVRVGAGGNRHAYTLPAFSKAVSPNPFGKLVRRHCDSDGTRLGWSAVRQPLGWSCC
jgi:hypothetical protein